MSLTSPKEKFFGLTRHNRLEKPRLMRSKLVKIGLIGRTTTVAKWFVVVLSTANKSLAEIRNPEREVVVRGEIFRVNNNFSLVFAKSTYTPKDHVKRRRRLKKSRFFFFHLEKMLLIEIMID